MTTSNATHPTATQAHRLNLPNQPLPSVIRRSIPIRLSAASMPVTFRSRADVAPSTKGLEASKEPEKDLVEALRARARSRRELVKSSCVEAWASRRVVVELDLGANGLI